MEMAPDRPVTLVKSERSKSLWDEIRRVTRPIIVDIAVFTLILFALLISAVGIQGLKATGYDKTRVHTFETMHYWCYASVYALFALDLVIKVILSLFFRPPSGAGVNTE
jgi:hypothetical protein